MTEKLIRKIGQTTKSSVKGSTNSVTLKDNQAPTETSTTQKQDQTPAKSTALDNDSQQTVQATVTPTTSINDQVGRTINVVTHDVTETTGNKATG